MAWLEVLTVNPRCTLKVKPTGCADKLGMGYREKEESRLILRLLIETTGKMEIPPKKITKTGKSRFWRLISRASLGPTLCEAHVSHPCRNVE